MQPLMPQRLLAARKTTSSVCLVNQPKREHRDRAPGRDTERRTLADEQAADQTDSIKKTRQPQRPSGSSS
jgi:hypothetical protein